MQIQHLTVYREPERYAGWPANYGIWAWGDEIVVAFTVGYPSPGGGFHARDRERPCVTMQARSEDGGLTWATGPCPLQSPGGRGVSADEHMRSDLSVGQALALGMPVLPQDCPGGLELGHPDLALMCARTGLGAGTAAWFYISYDRCRAWKGPYWLPGFGQPGIEARTDYLITDRDTCTLFLTAARAEGGEGSGVFCARTQDGGRTYQWLSWVARAETGYVIMPSSVRLSEREIVTAVRCRSWGEDLRTDAFWIDLYRSEDDGHTWAYVGRPVPDTGIGGNPPCLIRLGDGRLCLTYGYRAAPYGIRARLSADGGRSWAEELVLRDDGGSHDLGYPRTVQRPGGTIVTAYYFNDAPGGEGYIAATLWRP
ncbi:MAG: exo-alpha-sialidase [Anaerolineae bacterium]|nr:exo-alpha-sialidase [Anaerolineae bacterium]